MPNNIKRWNGSTWVTIVNGDSVPASSLTGTALPANIVSSSLTSVGTLASLAVTGNISSASGTISGNGSGLTSLNAGNLSSGTVPTARVSGAYTGITSLGTQTADVQISGNLSLRFSTWGGRFWMEDATWIRADKSFYNGGNTIANDGYLSIGNGGSTDANWPSWLNATRVSTLRVTGAADSAGNIRFDAANPYITASNYIHMPGGLFVNGGNLWVANTCHVRGSTGLYNDTGSLIVSGGSSGIMSWASTGFQTTASTSGYQYIMWGTTFGNIARLTSSRDTKEQIATLANTGAVIDALRPVSFIAKASSDEESDDERAWRLADIQHGFIAEEVAEIDTGRWAVWGPDDEDSIKPVMWRIPDMVALLVAEVKDLRQRVAALEGAA